MTVLVECKRDRVEGCRTVPRVDAARWREVRRGDCELVMISPEKRHGCSLYRILTGKSRAVVQSLLQS